jgi:molybdopterin converting factor small subunit
MLYFARFGELAGRPGEALIMPFGSTVRSVIDLIGARDARIKALIGYARMAVNAEWATPDTTLADGDELALMPPMSGG